ncbi:aminomethyl-transferring glycine dehydrogenase subunit GcvPA [Geopsychrobacter electrodiphilus]|uniref:aminomethyl-transferring glycine dehydrogenase subunit GcvPA n=1 Tax=Geopsychrobacter electrodiphilus TaxID=225196 RepID=UPI0003716E52|nr:aminomethyl-transferring glycine dehydrogenase subunit GcvPA [Geopsychrobacter electrodiphilus]
MRYLPHSDLEIQSMLKTIGVEQLEELFIGIPENCRLPRALDLDGPLAEAELLRRFQSMAAANAADDSWSQFLGGGYYDHHIPAVIDHLISRSEFYTAYTPYQPEISQGTLQAIYEFQTLICQLTGLDVANASLYDGASACAEAVLMSLRCGRNRTKILLSRGVHPRYREVIATYVRYLDVELIEVPLRADGQTDEKLVAELLAADVAALVVGYPNYLGVVEEIDALAKLAHSSGARMLVAAAEPLAMALYRSPGELGADIVVGEGQSFGLPLTYGGPGVGFIAARQQDMRSLPGRLVGETVDKDGERGFVLTLATREQHIRREKATSNICSNQGICAVMVSIYLALLGKNGLPQLARDNYSRAAYLREQIAALPGYSLPFSAPFFNEFVVSCSQPAAEVLQRLEQQKILAGISLLDDYPEIKNGLLICVTEQNDRAQLDGLVSALNGGAA